MTSTDHPLRTNWRQGVGPRKELETVLKLFRFVGIPRVGLIPRADLVLLVGIREFERCVMYAWWNKSMRSRPLARPQWRAFASSKEGLQR